MPSIIYGGQSYQCNERESVLDCMTAHGVIIPSSCHAGLCQTCLMHAVKGKVPASAQIGLKTTLAAQDYFLACACYPEEDIEAVLPSAGVGKYSATVVEINQLNTEIVCIELRPGTKLKYKAGQFINLHKDTVTARSYSLASVPEVDEHLHLHIRKLHNGLVSHWIHQDLKIGDSVEISDANGNCFYTSENPDQNLLLIGTGSGLTPLYGIIRDALLQEHRGTIKLYHGSNTAESLYLTKELESLSSRHDNFIYTPCISGISVPQGFASGRALDVAIKENTDLSGWRVFLCGHPEMVASGKKLVFFAGASMREIYADPFMIVPRINVLIPRKKYRTAHFSTLSGHIKKGQTHGTQRKNKV